MRAGERWFPKGKSARREGELSHRYKTRDSLVPVLARTLSKWRPHSRQRQRLRGHGAVGRRGPPGHLLTLFPCGRTRGDKAEPKTRGVDSSPSRLGGPSKFLYALGKDSACQKCVCFETSVTFGKEFAQLSPEESGSRAPRALDPGRTTWVTVKWTPGMEPPPRGTP